MQLLLNHELCSQFTNYKIYKSLNIKINYANTRMINTDNLGLHISQSIT